MSSKKTKLYISILTLAALLMPAEALCQGSHVSAASPPPALYAGNLKLSTPGTSETGASEFLRRLASLPTDSVTRLGTRFTLASPMVPDSALLCFVTAISREQEERGDRKAMDAIARAYINSSHIYSTVYCNFSEAYINLRKAESICLDYGFDSVLAHVYLNMATLFSIDSKLDSSTAPGNDAGRWREYVTKAFDLAEKSGNKEIMAYAVVNMTNDNDFDSYTGFSDYIRRYLEADVPRDASEHAYARAISLAVTAFLKGDAGEAHRHLHAIGSMSFKLRNLTPRFKEQARFLDGLIYERSGDIRMAEDVFNEILDSSKARGDLESMMWMQGNLYLFNRRRGRFAESDRYLLDYYRTRETIAAKGSGGVPVSGLELRETLSEYEDELEQSRIRDRRARWVVGAGSIVATLLIIILSIVLYYSRRQRNYIMALYERNINSRAALDKDDNGPSATEPEGKGIQASENDSMPEEKGSDSADPELMEKVGEILSKGAEVLDPDFSIARLCAMTGSNNTYVSRAVNARFGKPFKTVVAERRIAEACLRFDNPADNANLTVEAICQEVGFRSRAAFSVAFKNVTGLTPTEYRKAARRFMPAQ